MTLDQARDHIGHGVIYRTLNAGPGGGHVDDTDGGVITGVGEQFVFVRYAGERGPRATDPAALTLLAGDPR